MPITTDRVKVLHGHTSPDTAYVINDYPYGRTLRCKMRVWIETAEKGAYRGQQRVVRQTTNPKRDAEVFSNKPKASTYGLLVFLYLDPQSGHVEADGVSRYGILPHADAVRRLRGIIDQISEADRRVYELFVKRNRQASPETWVRWDSAIHAMAEAHAATGTMPGRSELAADSGPYLSDDEYAIAVAWTKRHAA